jgi:Spy/CpxP family protein refolding chaperone
MKTSHPFDALFRGRRKPREAKPLPSLASVCLRAAGLALCGAWVGLAGWSGAAHAAAEPAAVGEGAAVQGASGPALPEPRPPRWEGRPGAAPPARCEACAGHTAGGHPAGHAAGHAHEGQRAARRAQWRERAMDPDFMAQRLGLTPEQQAKFKPWAQAQRERLQALRQEGSSLRDSGRGLLSAPQRDDKAVAAWRERMLAHQTKMAQARLDQWIGMTQWMTPQQRSRWAQRPVPSGLDRRMQPMGQGEGGQAPGAAPGDAPRR